MRVKTVEEAKALAGTTWERDGLRRTVLRLVNVYQGNGWVGGCIAWGHPHELEDVAHICFIRTFNEWLAKATKVEN